MIDWKQADLQVFKLQKKRIYRATQKQELGEVVMQKKPKTDTSVLPRPNSYLSVDATNNGSSHTLRSGVKGNFHAPFWRPVWEGDLPAEFNNYLFAGSQDAAERTALFYSLIGSCKMAGVNPLTWFTDVIKNINNHPIQKLHLLLPSNWKAQQG